MQCHHYEEVVVGSCFFEKNKQTNKQTKQNQKGISQPGMIFLMVKDVLLLLQEKSNKSITNT